MSVLVYYNPFQDKNEMSSLFKSNIGLLYFKMERVGGISNSPIDLIIGDPCMEDFRGPGKIIRFMDVRYLFYMIALLLLYIDTRLEGQWVSI